jgi:hypothetical protein
VSAVVALSNKAFDLKMVGHAARELEYRQRALVAAQALGAPDCLLVAAQLQLDIANWIQSKLQTEVAWTRRTMQHVQASRGLGAVLGDRAFANGRMRQVVARQR